MIDLRPSSVLDGARCNYVYMVCSPNGMIFLESGATSEIWAQNQFLFRKPTPMYIEFIRLFFPSFAPTGYWSEYAEKGYKVIKFIIVPSIIC